MFLSSVYVVDKNGRLEVLCNGEGVLLVEAETDSTLQDIGLLNQSLDLSQLMPTLDYSGDISSLPLILLQVSFYPICFYRHYMHIDFYERLFNR